MNYSINEFAHDEFKDISTTTKNISIHLKHEPWAMQNILCNLSINDTSWENSDFLIDGFKDHDESGNSFWVGVLIINAKDKNKDDFIQLANAWSEEENNWNKYKK